MDKRHAPHNTNIYSDVDVYKNEEIRSQSLNFSLALGKSGYEWNGGLNTRYYAIIRLTNLIFAKHHDNFNVCISQINHINPHPGDKIFKTSSRHFVVRQHSFNPTTHLN